MAEEKKRFPWWLVVCAALLVPLAAVIGLIETVGRQGTVVGRYGRIYEGMLEPETLAVLGPPDITDFACSGPVQMYCWREGPTIVWVVITEEHLAGWQSDHNRTRRTLTFKQLTMEKGVFVLWHLRRWAEQAYTAIHGPSR